MRQIRNRKLYDTEEDELLAHRKETELTGKVEFIRMTSVYRSRDGIYYVYEITERVEKKETDAFAAYDIDVERESICTDSDEVDEKLEELYNAGRVYPDYRTKVEELLLENHS